MTATEQRTYTVTATWDDTGWWVVTVPHVPGAITQVRRLDQVVADAAEVIEIQTGEQVDPATLDVVPVLDDEAGQVAADARTQRRRADEVTREAAETTRRAVRLLHERGFTVRDIGRLVGITHQRAHQLVTTASP
ncbi:MAG: hypothetical protein L0H64_06710 [Pseudonocardia sp.]|nr:hypothetical protein [Pseudonocardia sp.]